MSSWRINVLSKPSAPSPEGLGTKPSRRRLSDTEPSVAQKSASGFPRPTPAAAMTMQSPPKCPGSGKHLFTGNRCLPDLSPWPSWRLSLSPHVQMQPPPVNVIVFSLEHDGKPPNASGPSRVGRSLSCASTCPGWPSLPRPQVQIAPSSVKVARCRFQAATSTDLLM